MLNAHLHKCLSRVYNDLNTKYNLQSPSGAKNFLIKEQGIGPKASSRIAPDGLSLERFLELFDSSEGSIEAPQPTLDLSHAISDYYISSSHNTYLTGNQLSSDSSTIGYKEALQRGCRCVEIDIWDGVDVSPKPSDDEVKNQIITGRSSTESEGRHSEAFHDHNLERSDSKSSAGKSLDSAAATNRCLPEPRVLHGYTATKDVSFRAVCETIRDYAFASRYSILRKLQ